MSLNEPDSGVAGLEAALAALAPLPGRLNRDALMFRAGQASVRRRPWLWPGAAAVLGLTAAALGVVVLVRSAAEPVERVVYVTVKEQATPDSEVSAPGPVPTAAEPVLTSSQSPMTYWQLEQQVLRWGLDGVPVAPVSSPLSPGPPMSRETLFGEVPASSGIPEFLPLRSFFP